MNIKQLVAHYKRVELPNLAPSTQVVYTHNLDNFIVPRWGDHALASIRPIEVENWLRGLKGLRGKDASPGVKSKDAVAVRGLLGDAVLQHPSAPQEEA